MGLMLLKNEMEDSPVSTEHRLSQENFIDLNIKRFCTDIIVRCKVRGCMQPSGNPVCFFPPMIINNRCPCKFLTMTWNSLSKLLPQANLLHPTKAGV